MAVFGSFAVLMYLSVSTFARVPNPSNPAFFRFQHIDTASDADSALRLARPKIDKLPAASGWSKAVLRYGKKERIGNIVLIYRGKEGGSTFRLDVIVPELDPQHAYLRKIDMAQARKGFQAGNERFKLLSANSFNLRLMHYLPAH